MTTQLDFETQLETIPIRNKKVRTYPAEYDPDALIAEVQLEFRGLFGVLAGMVKSRKSRRCELAGVAREMYERLDGKCTVKELILAFAEEENLTFLESRALVTQYLANLMKRGLIALLQV